MITWPGTHCMVELQSRRLNVWTGRSWEGKADELLTYVIGVTGREKKKKNNKKNNSQNFWIIIFLHTGICQWVTVKSLWCNTTRASKHNMRLKTTKAVIQIATVSCIVCIQKHSRKKIGKSVKRSHKCFVCTLHIGKSLHGSKNSVALKDGS